jgi:thioredoxin 1
MLIHLGNESEYDTLISKNKVLVDFYADWCGPCQMLAPQLEDLAKEVEGKVDIIKVNVDQFNAIAARYNVYSIPTLILFENGKMSAQSVGYMPKEKIRRFIKE